MNNNNNKNSIHNVYKNASPRAGKKIERDGVVYTPSAERKRLSGQEDIKRKPVPSPSGKRNSKKAQKPQKSQFAIFFILVMSFGAIACVVTFAMILGSFTSSSPSPYPTPTHTEFTITDPPDQGDQKSASITAVVQQNYADVNKLDLYDYVSDQKVSVFLESGSEMKDRYGNNMSFAEFTPGEIVDVVYIASSGKIKTLRLSVNTWKHTSISGAQVDSEESTIKLGGNVYSFDENTIVRYKGSEFNIAYLDAIDIINVEGYKEYVSTIDVVKSHGTLEVSARTDIINGVVEIDTNLILQLDEDISQPLAEGDHRIVVKGLNIESAIYEFSIIRNEVYSLPLIGIEFKGGVITIICDEPDVSLTINGYSKPLNEPLQMSFGTLELKAEKDGFHIYEQTIEFNEPELDVTLTMEKIPTIATLFIDTTPSEAFIYIDNVFIGISPLSTEVEFGLRTISFRKEGYTEIDLPIMINESNLNPSISLDLQPKLGW